MQNEQKAQHTPGPWGIEATPSTLWIGSMRQDGLKIHEIVTSIDVGGYKEEAVERKEANARLIAAAPELLHELEAAAGALREITRDLACIAQAIQMDPTLNRITTLAKLGAVNCERYEQRAWAQIAKATKP